MEEDRNAPAHVESDASKVPKDTQLVVEDHSKDQSDHPPLADPTSLVTHNLSSCSSLNDSTSNLDESKPSHPFAQAHILSMAIESESPSFESANGTKEQESSLLHSAPDATHSPVATDLIEQEPQNSDRQDMAPNAVQGSVAPLPSGNTRDEVNAEEVNAEASEPLKADRHLPFVTPSSSNAAVSQDRADDTVPKVNADTPEVVTDKSPPPNPSDNASGKAASKQSIAPSADPYVTGRDSDGAVSVGGLDHTIPEKTDLINNSDRSRKVLGDRNGMLESTGTDAGRSSSAVDSTQVADERETLSQIMRDEPSKSKEEAKVEGNIADDKKFEAVSTQEVKPSPHQDSTAPMLTESEICKNLLADSVVESGQPPLKKARVETEIGDHTNASSAETVSSSVKECERSSAKVTQDFETVQEALAALPTPHTIPVVEPAEHAAESTDNDDGSNSDNKRRGKRRRGDGESRTSVQRPIETRSAPGTPSRADDNDTEPEQMLRQSKRRRTIASASAGTASRDQMTTGMYELLPELTLQHLPLGWTKPLLYFVEGFDYDWGDTKTKKGTGDASKSKWLTYPDLRINNGAIYIDQKCSGVASLDLKDHLAGPTWLMRDLCSLFQAGSTPSLHPPNYVSLSRATARTQLKVTEPFTELATTKVFRAGSERESIQPLPLDFVCHLLVESVRAVVNTSGVFPSHLFAPEMHLWQFAPSLALHLMASGLSRSPAALLEFFDNGDLLTKLNCLKDVLAARTGTRTTTGSRRRSEKTQGRGKVPSRSGLKTFTLEADEKDLVLIICELIEERLEEFKKAKFEYAEKPSEEKALHAGDVIVSGIEVSFVPRTTAALRDRILSYYNVKPFIIQVGPDVFDDPEEYQEACKLYAKEEGRWVTTADAEAYLDFTISKDQEKWLMSVERCKSKSSAPIASAELNLLKQLMDSGADSSPNCAIKVSLPAIRYGDCCSSHSATISLVATQDINSQDKLKLATKVTRTSWTQLADDGAPAIEAHSQDIQTH